PAPGTTYPGPGRTLSAFFWNCTYWCRDRDLQCAANSLNQKPVAQPNRIGDRVIYHRIIFVRSDWYRSQYTFGPVFWVEGIIAFLGCFGAVNHSVLDPSGKKRKDPAQAGGRAGRKQCLEIQIGMAGKYFYGFTVIYFLYSYCLAPRHVDF